MWSQFLSQPTQTHSPDTTARAKYGKKEESGTKSIWEVRCLKDHILQRKSVCSQDWAAAK